MILREKDRLSLLKYFQSIKTPVEIWAYGSRVNGTAHDTSDFDLVIRTENLKPIPIEEYNDLIENIKESNIPILIEIRDWSNLPKSFHTEILKQYEVLYSNIQKNEH